MFLAKSDDLIKNMNAIKKYIAKRKSIVFLDLEGTQFSHECIAIGAVLATIKKNGEIKKRKEPFKVFVRPKNSIGKYVEGLTGITSKTISQYAVSFKEAIASLKKYIGSYFKHSLYMTYGSHDIVIIGSSIKYNLDAPKDDLAVIQKNYCDFHYVFQQYVKDDNNNSLSLVHACELFDCLENGKHHDPSCDAINLANLYNAFIKNRDLLFERYKIVLGNFNHLPKPIQSVVQKLVKGETVTPEFFDEAVKKEINND